MKVQAVQLMFHDTICRVFEVELPGLSLVEGDVLRLVQPDHGGPVSIGAFPTIDYASSTNLMYVGYVSPAP